MSIPVIDDRPGALDVYFRPGKKFERAATWPSGYLDGRTWVATVDDLPITVTTLGDVMTISMSAVTTTALDLGAHSFLLKETTAGIDEAEIVGNWEGSNGPAVSDSGNVVVELNSSTVKVSVIGADGGFSDITATGHILADSLEITNDVEARRVIGRTPVELLEHQPGVSRWRQKLAAARAGGLAVTIVLVGDSRIRSTVTRYRNAWPDRLVRRFYGSNSGSLGLLPPSQGTFNEVTDVGWPGGDNPWTFTGAVVGNNNFGVGWHAVNIPPAGSASISYFGDKIMVFYVRTPTGPTAAVVTLDGVTVAPINANGVEQPATSATYGTHGDYGHHTLSITPNNGTLILEGVQWFDGDAPFFHLGSVSMLDASHAGFSAHDWVTKGNNWTWQFNNADAFMGCGLVIHDTNDIDDGRTPQQFEDEIVALIGAADARLGNTNMTWVICHLPLPALQVATGLEYLESSRRAAVRLGLSRCSVYDLAGLRPGRVWGTDLSADGSHPNDAGHIWLAEAFGQILDPTPSTMPPVTQPRTIIDASTPSQSRLAWAEAWTALTGGLGGYDQSGGGTVVGERRHKIWLDAGTYRPTLTMQEDSGLGTVQVLIGNWQGNTPTLTSCGTKANAAATPTLVTTRLGTSVTTHVPGWCPVIIRKTSASGAIRFVNLVLDKIA